MCAIHGREQSLGGEVSLAVEVSHLVVRDVTLLSLLSGIINPRRACEGYCSWVCLSVCLLPLQPTSQLIVRLTNGMSYSAGNENNLKHDFL